MTKKRIVSAVLALMTVLTSASVLASCKKETGPALQKRTNVYGGVELSLPEGINYINQMAYASGYAYVTYYKEYTITYNEFGEEVERRLGYFWDDSSYDYVVDDDMIVEVMPYVAAEIPVAEEPVDMNGDGITDGAENTDNTEKRPDQGDMTNEEYYKTTGKLPVGWWYSYENNQNLCRISIEDGTYTEFPLKADNAEYGYMNNIRVAPDGRILATTNRWSYNEETGESGNTYYLLTIDENTGAIASADSLNDMFIEAGADPMNLYISNLVTAPDGSYYISSDTMIAHINADLKLIDSVSIPSGWINYITPVGEKLLVSYYEQSHMCKFFENGELVDINSAVLKEVLGNYYSILGTVGNSMYYQRDSGVFKYDFDTDITEEVLNYINSDIDSTNSTNMLVMEDGRLLFASTDWTQDQSVTTLSVLTKIPDEELKEEIIVKIGSVYSEYNLTRAIIRYNKQNTGIRLSLVSYDHYNNEDNNWSGAVQQFNNDIITGKLPDMIYLSPDLPVESYFQKGIFTDLNEFIDNPETGLDRTDFVESVMNANTVDGKLYSMIFNFTLYTLVAESEHVGTESGWTFEEMMSVLSSMPEGMRAFFDMGRDEVVNNLFRISLGSFVDWEAGTTNFDTQGFIDFMKYLGSSPKLGFWQEYYDSMGDEYVYDEEKEREMQEAYSLRYYNDTALFNVTTIGSYTDFLYQRNTFASKDITAIGYPTDKEGANGTVIVPSMEIAISSGSKVKDQAWEILKFFMTDEELNSGSYRFSISKARNEEKRNAAADGYYYYEQTDEDLAWYRDYGYSEEYITYMKNSNQPFDQAAIDYVQTLIDGAGEVQRTDEELVGIIKEEMSVFFSGTRSAEETARIIASRAKIYISENS